MPQRAPRYCTTPACGHHATKHGKCATHDRTSRRPRPSATAQGYGTEHRERFREGVLARDPICVLCRQAPSIHADHHPLSKRELRRRGLDDNDPKHGRGLCHSCHSSQTARHQPGGWNDGPAY